MSISVKDLDPAFQGLSNKPGLDVWRLDGGQVVAVPKADHGKFFTKDAYIVLKTSGSKHGGAVTYAIHYWLGKSTTQDDAALAAIKTVDLDAALGGKAAQYRETQGHESDLLLSYFRPCIIPTPGSWGKPDAEASQPRLLQVKGRRFIHVRQVPFARASLSHSEIFVLDTRSKLFQFNGANASKQERVKGMEVMQLLQDTQYGGHASIAIIDDGKLDDPDSNEFWELFGGFAPIAKKSASEDDVEAKPVPPTLYWVSGDGLQEMGAGALKKLQLEGNKCYLVDMGPTVFVWFGRISSLDERRAACIAAETQLVVGKKPPSVHVVRMPERFELPAFKACFSDWPVVPVLGGGEGGNKLKAMLKQSGVVDKAVAKGGAGGDEEHPPLAEMPGDLKAWRITGSTKAAVAAEEVGKFHAGESYLVQHTSIRDRKHEYLLFLWLGKDTAAAERTTATALAVRTMDALRGNVTLVRVVQGREPDQFLSLFKNHLLFLKGKAAGGGADAYDAAGIALFRVRARDNGLILAVQMDTVPRSLNSCECMLLQTPSNPFLWVGKNSSEADKAAATTAAEIFKPGVALKQLAEGKETSVFWGHLGAKGDYPAAREQREGQRDARLFHYTGTAAAAKVVEVPNYEQEDLISEDVMLLDTHTEVFVWVGVNLPDKEKKEAFDYAQRYVEHAAGSEGRSRDSTIIRVVEGFEPPMFTCHFAWDPTKTAAFVDPHERKLAHLQGREVELSDAAKRKLATLGLASSHPDAAAASAAAAPADVEPAPAAPAAEAAAAAAAPTPKESVSSQMAAAMAALKGSIKGVPTKPEPAAAAPAAAAPVAPVTPEPVAAAEAEAPMSAASQRAAAIAALSGTLTAEKRKSGGGAAYSIPKAQSPAAMAQSTPDPQPAASPAAATPSSPEPAPIPEGDEPSDVSGAEAAVEGAVYALERLTVNSTDPAPGIDTKKREAYLSDAEFHELFGCDKEAFYKQPKWKQDAKKRSLHLF
ncbi:hypothetical protein CLOM_g5489 [Closterium sp. NIES-68]|nr:hypothetical protein CLOM_g5489 [Closterium sp. NIES-68]GJP62896.1 hypothetical protein CLOP_g19963 [Closterium sp. NIES-67]